MGVGYGLLGDGNETARSRSEEEAKWKGIGKVWREIEGRWWMLGMVWREGKDDNGDYRGIEKDGEN